jgi:hypothetical protein
MKILKPALLITTAAVIYFSCQREIYFDSVSIGILKKDATGNCLPITVNGSFKTDSALTTQNFIDVLVEVSFPGTFRITSDTVNGYYFHQTGNIKRGSRTIRLFGSGKPLAAGINNFTVTYGTSTCNLSITVSGLQAAVFTLAGAPATCTGIYADGDYTKGQPLTPSNILTLQANVTTTGIYSITAATNNGFSFSGNGIFTTTGLQNVILRGTGTPTREEVSNVIANNIVSTCNFGITVKSDTAGQSLFSFDGTPNNCINYTVKGDYYAGIICNAGDTVTMNVNVSRRGTYSINTNTADGISFSASGSFVIEGPQTVRLLASGTPLHSGLTDFIPNTGTQSCNFLVDVQPLPPPAIFTLSGAPGDCSPVTVNSFYIVTRPLDAANTVIIQVNVSTPGYYSISTNTNNGMTFSATGVFTTTGLTNVILQGSGIPEIRGITVMTPHFSISSCTFSVLVQ